MTAANNDPMLAAWAAIFYEHGILSMVDVYPYEVWEAYQSLYNYDFVSRTDFNYYNERRFLKQAPTEGDVQHVICRIEAMCPEHSEQEIEMPNDHSSNPFATDNAIAPRSRDSGLSRNPSGDHQTQSLGNPFVDNRSVASVRTRERDQTSLDFFSDSSSPSGLACQNESSISPDGQGYTPDVRCCGNRLSMAEVGKLNSDGDGSYDNELVLAVFEGICTDCGLIHHNSVGRQADPGAFR